MTLKYILVGYRGKNIHSNLPPYSTLKDANKAGNIYLNSSQPWDHFTVVPVAIPDEDDLSLM